MSYTVKEIYWKRPTLFPVVSLGSTTPSSVSLHNAQAGWWYTHG
jgi:hypothetical protein